MKRAIATEQIFSPLGHRTAVKYHYEDGTSRTISNEQRKADAMQIVHKIIKNFNSKKEIK